MIADAEKNTPSPALFGLVLRWFSQTGTVLEVPTWMPVSPAEMKSDAKMNKNDVLNYLKWSYSNNAVDLEAFSEVAAAYHAAKAMSYLETAKDIASGYADMIERFVDAVHEDMGHAFLFSILTHKNCPDPTKETPEAEKVIRISNIEAIQAQQKETESKTESESEGGEGAVPTDAPTSPPASPQAPSVTRNTLKFPSAASVLNLFDGFIQNIGADKNEIVNNISEARVQGQVIHETASKLLGEIESVDGAQFAQYDVPDNSPTAFLQQRDTKPLSKILARNAANRVLVLFEAFVPEGGRSPTEQEIIDRLPNLNFRDALNEYDDGESLTSFIDDDGVVAIDVLKELAGASS